MCQPRPVMVALRGEEYLGLPFQPAERFGMQDPVAVPLIDRPQITRFLVDVPSLRAVAERGIRTEYIVLPLFKFLS